MANPSTDVAPELQVVEMCWSDLSRLDLVRQTWPREAAISGMESLHRWAPAIHESLHLKHTLIERFGVIPIVAVVGLLNSGKSSLTASLLSEGNRKRVLRGIGNRQGSQRFTLWIPHRWREEEAFYAKLIELLACVFGAEPETLSDDDDEAKAQQNDVRALASPLIGMDSALSEHRLAIFDCPDIQRAQQPDHNRTRLDLVGRVAGICASVIVVFTRNQIGIRDLQEILARMPDARRLYAVNMIRNEPASQVREEAAAILNLSREEAVYGAYDFLTSQYETHTPSWDPNRDRDSDARMAASQPCFFEIDADGAENRPQSIDAGRSLLAVAAKLSPDALQGRRLQELAHEFFKTLQVGLDALETLIAKRQTNMQDASRRLLDECQHLINCDGHPCITMSPAIVSSVDQSLARTASVSYRWLLLPSRKFIHTCIKLVERGRVLAPLIGLELRAKNAELDRKWQTKTDPKIAAGMVSVDDLARMLSLWSGATGDYRAPETWQDQAETILTRFAAEDKTNLTDDEWDELTTKLWKQIPAKARRRLVISASLMLGGVMLAFVDGGVSLVTFQAMDLLGGLGVLASLGLNLRSAKEFECVLEEKLGLRQVANFHAIISDTVGLPREVTGDTELPVPAVSVRLATPSYGVEDRQWADEQLNQQTISVLRSYGL